MTFDPYGQIDEARRIRERERLRSICVAVVGGLWISASVAMYVYWHTPVGSWLGR